MELILCVCVATFFSSLYLLCTHSEHNATKVVCVGCGVHFTPKQQGTPEAFHSDQCYHDTMEGMDDGVDTARDQAEAAVIARDHADEENN
jgi:hypothetical protein